MITGKLSLEVPTVSISNGLGWSLDNTTMYYIDSVPRCIYLFDYNLADGVIANQKVCVNFNDHGPELGFPDGMCTDVEGRLWVACFGGDRGRILCIDPKTGDILLSVTIPGARNITSCCFGGPDHSWLFITSAGLHMVSDPSTQPNGGNVFVIKDLGTRGHPGTRLKL